MQNSSSRKAMIVLTSHSEIGDTGRKTGFYFDEMATPYWALTDAGFDVELASIKGGEPPADPTSLGTDGDRKPAVERFLRDADASQKLKHTKAVTEVEADQYAIVFLPGGHGTMWDFAQSEALGRVVSEAYASGALIGAVCHGPAGLLSAKRPDGRPLVDGLRVNGFTDTEEDAVGLTGTVPFLLESRLRALGGRFESAENFQSHVATDIRLVTGQNPQSVPAVTSALVAMFEEV